MGTVELLADHYQKTYELTYEMWKERNNIFLLLLGGIGFACLLTFHVPETDSLLLDLVIKLLDIQDSARIAALRQDFPFPIFQVILMIVISYLMGMLYQRTVYINRNYQYLGILEKEIQANLKLLTGNQSFTREGEFYWSNNSYLLIGIKWLYVIVLGGLLGGFFLARILQDWGNLATPWILIEIGITVVTAIFFVGYTIPDRFRVSKKTARTDLKPEGDVTDISKTA